MDAFIVTTATQKCMFVRQYIFRCSVTRTNDTGCAYFEHLHSAGKIAINSSSQLNKLRRQTDYLR